MGWSCPHCRQANIVPSTHQCGPLAIATAASGQLPYSQQPKKLDAYNGKDKRIERHAFALGIRPVLLRKYDAAMQNWGNDIGSRASEWRAFKGKFTLDDITGFDDPQHVATVNEIWREIIDFRPYDRTVGEMVDPGAGNDPSSRTRPGEPMFQRFGICFRCDARTPESVTKFGFKPFYAFSPPEYALETILQHCTTGHNGIPQSAGFWVGNRDIVNQTSICASRGLRGCGKFPTPSDTGTHYFYAFKFSSLKKGFDTEALQVQTGGRWLPGEKAFPAIDPHEILGHAKVEKLGSDTGNDAFNTYQYRIEDADWTFTGNATGPEKEYLTAELHAVTEGQTPRVITVTKAEDFASGE